MFVRIAPHPPLRPQPSQLVSDSREASVNSHVACDYFLNSYHARCPQSHIPIYAPLVVPTTHAPQLEAFTYPFPANPYVPAMPDQPDQPMAEEGTMMLDRAMAHGDNPLQLDTNNSAPHEEPLSAWKTAALATGSYDSDKRPFHCERRLHRHARSQPGTYRCAFEGCYLFFSSPGCLARHENTQHRDLMVATRPERVPMLLYCYMPGCRYATRAFKRRDSYLRYVRNVHGDQRFVLSPMASAESDLTI